MNWTQIRNRVGVFLTGSVATAVTYLSLRQFPDLSLSSVYIQVNVVVFVLLVGAVALTRWEAQTYWYEIVSEFFLWFAATSLLAFFYFAADPLTVGLLIAGGVLGVLAGRSVTAHWGTLYRYQFVGLLLSLSFGFVILYFSSAIIKSMNPTLFPPLLLYLAVFASLVYGVREEVQTIQP